ncbi:IS630 family transposase [Streptomyces roseochromogenus]|nr:IS630 family transposase [Streptomyces roseochromogenus]
MVLSDAERAMLQSWVRRRSSAQSLALRSRIVLESADGHAIAEVARRLGITTDTVRAWRRRFLERRLDGLCDEPRPGVPRKITDADVERVIVKTLEETPKDATHWSTRSMATATGMSQSAISRIWRAFALQPHRAETFKLSKDPLFIDKVRDVVGLYLDPPERALVLCVDEKSQIQALDRSQPVLPMMPGVPERRSHDYVRAGTTTSSQPSTPPPARSSAHSTAVTARWSSRSSCSSWTRKYRQTSKSTSSLHFTPTGSSWLNLAERWFAELTTKKLRRGVHRSVQALERDIRAWLTDWNEHPRPFVWTKTADEILDKLASYCRRISDSGH